MKKIMLILMFVISLQASDVYTTTKTNNWLSSPTFIKICIDNVYYIKGYGRLTVWINPKTLKPSNCK